MPNKVVHYKSIGQVTFNPNRRSKSMKISVRPDKSVLVSYPFFVKEKEILTFLAKHESWVIQQQQKAGEKRKRFREGMVIKTRIHTIEFHLSHRSYIEPKGDVLKFYAPSFQDEEVQLDIEHMLTKVYRLEAHIILPRRLQELARQHGFSYNQVSIRNNKRSWGSCSSRNNISLNLQMMKLPDELIDYILLHELVHTEIKDHSQRFWQRLGELTNNRARELANEVRNYSTYTI